jgi:hypothetical protein
MPETVAAPYGEKTVLMTVRFFTSDLAGPGLIRPRHVWDQGFIRVMPNEAHGIADFKKPFHGMTELRLEDVLAEAGITVHQLRGD